MSLDVVSAASAIGVTLAGVGFFLSFRQYKIGQSWQKAQVLSTLIDSFETDELIDAACKMLDWDERDIKVEGIGFHFKNEMLIDALRVVPIDSPEEFPEPWQIAVRDSFDTFFDYFERLYSFEQGDLLKFQDYKYFFYWFLMIDRIRTLKNTDKSVPALGDRVGDAITEYRMGYKFRGFNALFLEYQDYCKKHPKEAEEWELHLPGNPKS